MNNDYKIISISPKRQITIPQKIFSRFNFGSQAKIFALDNGILIQPTENISDGAFDTQILQDLVLQKGLSGQKSVLLLMLCSLTRKILRKVQRNLILLMTSSETSS